MINTSFPLSECNLIASVSVTVCSLPLSCALHSPQLVPVVEMLAGVGWPMAGVRTMLADFVLMNELGSYDTFHTHTPE